MWKLNREGETFTEWELSELELWEKHKASMEEERVSSHYWQGIERVTNSLTELTTVQRLRDLKINK